MTNNIMEKMAVLSEKGYCCSQILFLLAFESRGGTSPDLVRSMAGLCNGLGYSGEICGVLTGASCLIAFFAAKGSDEEQENERFTVMVSELVQWFHDKIGGTYGGIQCDDILGDDILGEKQHQTPDQSICANILAETYVMAIAILEANGIKTRGGEK